MSFWKFAKAERERRKLWVGMELTHGGSFKPLRSLLPNLSQLEYFLVAAEMVSSLYRIGRKEMDVGDGRVVNKRDTEFRSAHCRPSTHAFSEMNSTLTDGKTTGGLGAAAIFSIQ